MTMPPDARPLSELLSDALNQLSALIRTELQLARTELTGKAAKAAMGMAMMAGGLAVAIAALVLIFLAIAEWLDNILPEGFALFGPFSVGMRCAPADLGAALGAPA